MMQNSGRYEFISQDRIIYGIPAAEAVLETAEHMGAERVFLVTSKTLSRKTDEVDKIKEALGNRYIGLFDECVAHVPRSSVISAADLVRKANPDLVVTIGGGTPIDTAKLLLLCLAENITDEETLGEYRIRVLPDGTRHVPKVGKPPFRQVVVPSTLSGAEFSNLGGCSDPKRKVKDLYTGREIGAQVVILDPALTIHTPEWLWMSTGVRALDHAVETVCSRNPQPFTDATCLHGISLLSESLRRSKIDPSDMDARLKSQLGVWLASTGLGRIEWGASHGIGHQLGAVANVPHGYTSCVMLHNVLDFNMPVNAERQALVSEALGDREQLASSLIKKIVEDLELPSRLRDVGVKKSDFEAIASGSMENMMVRSNPRPILSQEDVMTILEQAW